MTAPAPGPRITSIAGDPVDPTVDMVRVAVRGMVVATLAGVGVAALALALVRALLAGAAPTDTPAAGPAFYVLIAGMLVAMGVGAGTAWLRLSAMASPFRRGVFAMIAAFATFVGALLATPVHYRFGQAGLLGYAAVALGLSLALGRRRK
jgi:hypothetical protein